MAGVVSKMIKKEKGASKPPPNIAGIGKGELILPKKIKRELYNETYDGTPHKKRKNNNTNNEWIDCGKLEFYLEVPRVAPGSEEKLIKELQQHRNKLLKVTPHDDSYNPSQIRVGIPGRIYDCIWRYGGDIYLTRFLAGGGYGKRTKLEASIPDQIEIFDDPKRLSYSLVTIDIHFYLHKDINLFEHPGKNVKRQVKQLINYMRGGTQPNPAKCTWPVIREDMEKECIENANMMDRLMKKKTAKDWWKCEDKK